MRVKSSVVECVAAHAGLVPDKLCLADGNGACSYAQAWQRIEACARRLHSLGVGRESYVLVACDQSVEYVLSMLGVQLAGAIAVPLEKNAAESRCAEIAAETQAACFMGRAEAPWAVGLVFLDMGLACSVDEASEADGSDWTFPAGDDVAEILFSTGTTGKSKGIVITHRNNMALAENVICGLEMKPDNVEIVPMPLSHSHGLRRTYANLVNGSSVVLIAGALALKKMLNIMDEYHVTAMDLSPSLLSIIFKLSRDRLGEYADVLDYVQLGSAPLAEDDKQHLRRLLPATRLYNFYGSTEAGCSCLLEFGKDDKGTGCIGKPAVNAHFIVVDADRNPIQSSPDNLGLLASSGDINMRCYFNEPELTAEAMQGGFLYTKDLGYIDDEGYVYMLGREDDVINFGGVKVAPEEIESAVAKSPIVADCACIPIPDALCGQVPILCIVLESGAEYDMKEFKTFLAGALDANKQPQRVEVLDEIPRTFNGKIQRKELTARFSKKD